MLGWLVAGAAAWAATDYLNFLDRQDQLKKMYGVCRLCCKEPVSSVEEVRDQSLCSDCFFIELEKKLNK